MKKIIPWIFAGIALRLVALWLLPNLLTEDAGSYFSIADNLSKTGHYFNSEGLAYRPPLEPLFIYLMLKIFGSSLYMLSVCQIVISIVTAVMIGKIARGFFLKEPQGELPMILALLSFDLSLFAPLLMSETIYIFLVIMGFWLLSAVRDKKIGSIRVLAAAAFLSWGLAVLGKPSTLIVFCALAAYLLYKKLTALNFGNSWWIFLILVFPSMFWSARNWIVFHRFVYVSSNGGVNLYIGNNPYSSGSYDKDTEKITNLYANYSEVEKDSLYRREAMRYISQHPLKTIQNIARKPFYLMATFGGSAEGAIIRGAKESNLGLYRFGRIIFGIGQLATYWLVLFGTIYYLAVGREKNDILRGLKSVVSPRRMPLPSSIHLRLKHRSILEVSNKDDGWFQILMLFLVFYILSLLPFFTFPRFRIPMLPFLIIIGSLGIKKFQGPIDRKKIILATAIFVLLTARDWLKMFAFLSVVGKLLIANFS